ncbi:MAG: S41 family peptidase [Candidatus Peribacteraceae bacterium]|nr:S41 family peptidase [Candidatus Peribacteraceae bacterium]
MKKNIIITVGAAIIFFVSGLVTGNFFFSSKVETSEIPDTSAEVGVLADSKVVGNLDIRTFDEVWKTTERKFVDVEKLEPQKMLYGAMKGVVESLGDPHSEFLDPQESEEFLDSLEGELTGIGAEVGMRNEVLTIISPLRGSPAERSGLLPGDQVYKIDDEFAADYTLFEAIRKIRGPIGTDVMLTVFRGEEVSPREITITRELITIESVHTEMRDDGIAVVTVNNFADNTAEEFAAALADLALENPDGIILDLRFNGGGFLDAAIAMTSNLLSSGDVVQIHERGKTDAKISVIGAAILPSTPLVVLVNEGSASASEILAGALQDAGRATVLGEQTFGKGTVQELISGFRDGSTLRITVAKWFTPSGRDIDGIGLEPDISIEMPVEDYFTDRDPQLAAAVEFLQTGQVAEVENSTVEN